jgi:hypothetical protein
LDLHGRPACRGRNSTIFRLQCLQTLFRKANTYRPQVLSDFINDAKNEINKDIFLSRMSSFRPVQIPPVLR